MSKKIQYRIANILGVIGFTLMLLSIFRIQFAVLPWPGSGGLGVILAIVALLAGPPIFDGVSRTLGVRLSPKDSDSI